jgi:alanine dehydrogenase
MSEERKIKMPNELLSMNPKEEALMVMNKHSKIFIGIPKERTFQENRISLTPEAVALLVDNGARVVIESKAGDSAHIYDIDYTEAGAEIVHSRDEIFKADIIIKSAPITEEEVNMMGFNQVIISPIHLPTIKAELLHQLISKRATSLAFEYIKDSADTFPIVSSMSEIAGNTSMLIAAEYLSNLQHGKGVLLGGITGVPPAIVVILGAGTVGEYAAQTAIGLGAEVRVFDNSIYKLKRLQSNLGKRVYTSILRQDTLADQLKDADVAIGAMHSKSGRTPIIVNEEMVSHMKAGSVIIDVSIDQGGCFETSEVTTHDKPFFKKFDVIHYCVPNIASRVPRTASTAISNVLTPILIDAGKHGGFDKLLYQNPNLRNGVYIYKGCLTNQHLSEKFRIKYTDLDLLFAAAL